jgi:hypothetical protein
LLSRYRLRARLDLGQRFAGCLPVREVLQQHGINSTAYGLSWVKPTRHLA